MSSTQTTTTVIRRMRDGRMVMPAEFWKALGVKPGGLMQVTLDGNELQVAAAPPDADDASSPWFKELYDYFAPAREEEINDAIDEAVRAVRADRAKLTELR